MKLNYLYKSYNGESVMIFLLNNFFIVRSPSVCGPLNKFSSESLQVPTFFCGNQIYHLLDEFLCHATSHIWKYLNLSLLTKIFSPNPFQIKQILHLYQAISIFSICDKKLSSKLCVFKFGVLFLKKSEFFLRISIILKHFLLKLAI